MQILSKFAANLQHICIVCKHHYVPLCIQLEIYAAWESSLIQRQVRIRVEQQRMGRERGEGNKNQVFSTPLHRHFLKSIYTPCIAAALFVLLPE